MKNKTAKLLFKRIAGSVITLFLIVTFIFFLVRLSPGDPSLKFISPSLSPGLAEKVRESLNLNQPLHLQYIGFLTSAVQGDLGVSYNFRREVVSVIMDYLPFTILFVVISFILQMIISFGLAIKSIKKINGIFDRIFSKLTLFLYAAPVFVTGVFLVFIFSELLNLFPSSGLKSYDFEDYTFFGKMLDYLNHLILPILTLALAEVAIFYKYLRDNLEDVFNKLFVLNLRANGVSEKDILIKHVIPNAINPLITIAGIELGIMLGGTLIVEVVFGLPGMGRLTIDSILSRDYPLVIGCSLAAGVLIISANFLADIFKASLDKRLLEGSLR
ncbi:MAG TPA: ABC transporter permease [Ignavibacteriaceae bacterium]|nr:ABC transporter permease [Ignavibacteriaceae bacterium]